MKAAVAIRLVTHLVRRPGLIHAKVTAALDSKKAQPPHVLLVEGGAAHSALYSMVFV